MGCNSDYMNPTGKEKQLRETAELYAYALRAKHGEDADYQMPVKVLEALSTPYTSVDVTSELCEFLRKQDLATFESIVYNARNKDSRRLAQWWEDHEAADRKRIAQEIQDKFKADPVLSQFIGMREKYIERPESPNGEADRIIEGRAEDYKAAIEREARQLAQIPFIRLKDALEVADGARPPKSFLKHSYQRNSAFKLRMSYPTLESTLCSMDGYAGLNKALAQLKSGNAPGYTFLEYFWTEVLQCCEASGLVATLRYCHDGVGVESWHEITLTVPVG